MSDSVPATMPDDRTRSRSLLGLACILAVAAIAIATAMMRTSTTFDEIVMISAGARGYEVGNWEMAREHPPVVQYLYGLPAFLDGPRLPLEDGFDAASAPMGFRYLYAQRMFWLEGNDPERLAFLGRLPAVLAALALAGAAFFFTRRRWGSRPALAAAALVAFMPDVLAHGGVAYNDVPVALGIFLSAWMIDDALRQPGTRRALLAGLAVGLTLGVKNSAVALAPIALLLLLAEAGARRRDRAEWIAVARTAAIAMGVAYLVLVAVYRGDFALTEYRYALSFVFAQVERAAPAFLLGESTPGGWWYYFPVAFLYKTSAGFHVLLLVALAALAVAFRAEPRRALSSGLRMPVAIVLVLGFLLLRSSLDIGFRYALPLLAPLAVIAVAGVARAWRAGPRLLRGVVTAAFALALLHPLSYWPHFLAYVSEYGPGRDLNHRVLADSSLDWGQGLLELRDWMRENDVPRVYLSYFGSALPAGYGIEYVPLRSFFPLPAPIDPSGAPPEYVAISATNLAGAYFGDDPYRHFRELMPVAVLGHTIFVYRLEQAS